MERAEKTHPGTPTGRNPAEILAAAQTGKFLIQDFRPLPESLEWELGQRYYRERGNKAFIGDAMPIPFAINNNSNMSAHAAQLFFASLVEADKAESLEDEFFVLELGIGVGLFARYFLDCFRELCRDAGKTYYGRLTYIAGDRSEQMLLDACRHGVFSNHPGRYLLRVVDALAPGAICRDLALPQSRRPLRAVFLNYLLDCLPATVLSVSDSEVRQLYVRTCLPRGVPLSEYTDLTADDIAGRSSSTNGSDKKELLQVFGLFTLEYDYRPASMEKLPYGSFAADFARSQAGGVLHNYGALQCLEGLLPLIADFGFVLMNDYGSTKAMNAEEFEHQRFSSSTAVGVNFALLKAYFLDKNVWVEPTEENDHIISRLLGNRIGTETKEQFCKNFGKTRFEYLEEPVKIARQMAQTGRFEAAAASYQKALARQPRNWFLVKEVAVFLTFQLRNLSVALELAQAALALNPNCSADLWNAFGDCLYALGKSNESRQAFKRALQINPDDVAARYNLSWVFVKERKYREALSIIADALALDKMGQYRDRLLQKQAEILSIVSQRTQQEYLFMANRVSRLSSQYYELEGPTGTKPAAGAKEVKLDVSP